MGFRQLTKGVVENVCFQPSINIDEFVTGALLYYLF